VKVTTHGSSLVQLTRLGHFNCYLVREDDGFTLVDTNLSGSAKGILEAARDLGAPITRIALTHAHSDHVGSVDALLAELPDAELMIGAREARFMRGDKSLDPDEPQRKLRGGFPKVSSRPSRELVPGDRVGSLEVVASPGHTPGHVAYLDTRNRDLIAGDALQTKGGIAVAGVIRPRFPLPALGTWDKATARESAVALRALEPGRLAVGHGDVLDSPADAMAQAIAEAG
jgi:glyoxylase-like metal-dependent hydrolase (beta-lactamase superfamily II)